MLVELLEFCLEPKRIDHLQNLNYLLSDVYPDPNESSLVFYDPNQQNDRQNLIRNDDNLFLDNEEQNIFGNNEERIIYGNNEERNIYENNEEQNIYWNSRNNSLFRNNENLSIDNRGENLLTNRESNRFQINGQNRILNEMNFRRNSDQEVNVEQMRNEIFNLDLLNTLKSLENNKKLKHLVYKSSESNFFENLSYPSPFGNNNLKSIFKEAKKIVDKNLDELIVNNLSLTEDWQDKTVTIKERNAILFNNEYLSDIVFLVGNKNEKNEDSDQNFMKIPAHKLILSIGSSVFYAMFHSRIAEKSSIIELPDVDPEAFLTLLRYLYCDVINLNSDNVLQTLYVAKKYIVNYLSNACIEFLLKRLDSQNACILLNQILAYEEEKEFINQCFEIIDAQCKLALSSPTFIDINKETLKLILKRNTLNADETFIFNACLKWADAECIRKNLISNSKNKREILDDLLFLIRFTKMNLHEFANDAAQSMILSYKETNNIFLYLISNIECEWLKNFNKKKRKGLELLVCEQIQPFSNHINQLMFNECDNSIQFLVDKKIFLAGFSLYTNINSKETYNLKIQIKKKKFLLKEKLTQFKSNGLNKKFKILFDNAIEIIPNQLYNASIQLNNFDLNSFGQDSIIKWQKDDISVTFNIQYSKETKNISNFKSYLIKILFYLPSYDYKINSSLTKKLIN